MDTSTKFSFLIIATTLYFVSLFPHISGQSVCFQTEVHFVAGSPGVNLIGDELPFTIAVDPDAVLPWSIGGMLILIISF